VTEICDGVDNDCDGVADNTFPDLDTDGFADCVDKDIDGDNVLNDKDNCPTVANIEQTNTDQDAMGNACDLDDDADGVLDVDDNCILVVNPAQMDADQDKVGDVCDGDKDGDGVTCLDALSDCLDCNDNDPAIHGGATEICDGKDNDCNKLTDEGFLDTDEDTAANCVDVDDDNDGTLDAADCNPLDVTIHPGAAELCDGVDQNCNGEIDENIGDTDKDGIADCVDTDDDDDGVLDTDDNCPLTLNVDQINSDVDAQGDACDDDDDNDTVFDALDNCSLPNADQLDTDEDQVGDVCDPDDDDDEIFDVEDNCPLIVNAEQEDNDEDNGSCQDSCLPLRERYSACQAAMTWLAGDVVIARSGFRRTSTGLDHFRCEVVQRRGLRAMASAYSARRRSSRAMSVPS